MGVWGAENFGNDAALDFVANAVVEPMAGPCGNKTSLFAHQEPFVLDTRVIDFGVTTTLGVPENGWMLSPQPATRHTSTAIRIWRLDIPSGARTEILPPTIDRSKKFENSSVLRGEQVR